jgi:cytoskeletal protein CcmA (bactofilin family)
LVLLVLLVVFGGGVLHAQPAERTPVAEAPETAATPQESAAPVAPAEAAAEKLREVERLLQELEEAKRQQRDVERNTRRLSEELESRQEALEKRIESAQEALEAAREVREEALEAVREAAREAPRPPRPPRVSRSDQKFSIGATVRVREGEVASDIVSLGGSIKIDGEVRGSAVAIGGDVKVNGRVTGDVVAVGNGVELGPNAEVRGDVVSAGGKVERAEGARVGGRVSEVSLGAGLSSRDWLPMIERWDRRGSPFGPGSPFSPPRAQMRQWLDLLWGLAVAVFLLVVAAMAALVMPDSLERVRAVAIEQTWKALLMGLAVELLFIPGLVVLSVLLVLTIIGIPLLLLLPFVVLLLLVAALFGYAAVALAVGRWLGQRFGLGLRGRLVALAIGVGAIQGLSLAEDFLHGLGIPFFIYALFGLCGFLLKFVSWTIGLGAVTLTRFGYDRPRPVVTLPPLPR